MLSVVSDELTPNGEAQVINAKDYYPFGMSMPSRTTEGGTYRYGFNGKETDPETGIQDYGMRWYLSNTITTKIHELLKHLYQIIM